MISIEQVGVPQAADFLHSRRLPSHSLSIQPHTHTHSINCETHWAFQCTKTETPSLLRRSSCLMRALVLQTAVECISQLAQIKRESDCVMKQLERHEGYTEMLIHHCCFSLDVLSVLQMGLWIHSSSTGQRFNKASL